MHTVEHWKRLPVKLEANTSHWTGSAPNKTGMTMRILSTLAHTHHYSFVHFTFGIHCAWRCCIRIFLNNGEGSAHSFQAVLLAPSTSSVALSLDLLNIYVTMACATLHFSCSLHIWVDTRSQMLTGIPRLQVVYHKNGLTQSVADRSLSRKSSLLSWDWISLS